MTEETILDLVIRAGDSQFAAERAVSGLAEYLYTRFYHFRLNCRDEDLRGDYLVWLYPRLSCIIAKYNPDKASLGTYLNWVIRLSFRTFMRNRYCEEARERACETEETTHLLGVEAELENGGYDECLVSETAGTYDRKAARTEAQRETASSIETPRMEAPRMEAPRIEAPRLSAKKREIRSRKLLLLACKAGNYIDDDQIEKIARLSGYDEAYLREKIECIRAAGEKGRVRARRTIERQNGYYIRARKCLIELKYAEHGSPRREALEKEYRFCRERWEALRRGKRTRVKNPSNRFLAGTLGISRGTIDSTLAQAMQEGYDGLS